MNIFVSYTTRNNEVTIDSLNEFSSKVNSFGKIFIDMLDNNSTDKQARIVQELEKSDIIILIVSESTYQSQWVELELAIANKMDIPVLEVQISQIDILTKEEIRNRISSLHAKQQVNL